MSWGIELWDQYENVSVHTQRGIDFLEKFGHFLRDRASIELEYAGKLRKLVKGYQPKKKDEDDAQFTSFRAFRDMLNEINDLAGQHEVISESLMGHFVREIFGRVKEFKEDRKKYLVEGQRHTSVLSNQLSNLDRAKKNYEKTFRDSEKSYEQYQRADADLNLSRAEVEKTKTQSILKSQQCEDTKKDYASHLDKTNDLQNSYYKVWMPGVFQGLQEVDEKRVKCMQVIMKQSTLEEKKVYPIINKCLDGIVRAADEIDEGVDSQQVIDKYKSGFQPPEDIPFEDLSAIKNGECPPPVQANGNYAYRADIHGLTNKGTKKNSTKHRVGLFNIFSNNKGGANEGQRDDYADLPPNQRRKKLQQKIDEISGKIQQENAAKDALVKMQSVYQQNPNLGDPQAIEGQLRESVGRLTRLQQELQKYQAYMQEAESDMTYGGSQNGIRTSQNNRSSGSDESLSRSASDLTQNIHNRVSAPGTPLASHGSSNSPESGISTSHTSLPDSDFDHNEPDNGDYYDQDPLPVLGTCGALYAFDATSEGSIPMGDHEQMYVVELDQGDGWTRVRRMNSLEEGFVPTSYIRITLYSEC